MEPLWKVKGFEQHMERMCSRLRFSQENEQNSDTDMYMPPLVLVRTLFFFFFFLFFFLVVSSLSSFIFFPLSFCLLSPCHVALVLCLVCVSVLCVMLCVVWCVRSKRLPCLDLKRLRVYRHHAHMCFNMCAWCRHTRGRF